MGDVFVDGNDSAEANKTIGRFIRAFFGDNGASPSRDEYGMYAAAAASYRSIDLSRQVGAAIFSKAAEIISLGCNEVPKAKGGTYWCDDDTPTSRDFDRGRDANQERRDEILHDLVECRKRALLTERPKKTSEIQSYVQRLLRRRAIADSQLMDIIEFGRMIHAEMSAISDAARLGRPTKEGTLFTTTFPCHIVRNISLRQASRMTPKTNQKVLFQPFIGISPRRYRDIFEKKKRKIENKIADWYEGRPAPRIEDRSSSYIENEAGLAYYALGELYRR